MNKFKAPAFWWQKHLNGYALLLLPLSWLYGLLFWLRKQLYQWRFCNVERLPVPVIVVGNLTVGGTGKTPLVIALVEQLRAQGWTPGVISRGYGGTFSQKQKWHRVQQGDSAAFCGDEPLLIAHRTGCPVMVGMNRVQAARMLLQQHPEMNVLISDDGLQHLRLGRDLEILVIDGVRRFGNGCLLPAGPLRERTARRVDFCVCREGTPQQGEWLMRLVGSQLHSLAGESAELNDWDGKAVTAVAGIGFPERFFARLETAGLQVERHPLSDHCSSLAQELQPLARPILLTEKDVIKLSQPDPHIWFLPVQAQLDSTFWAALQAKLLLCSHIAKQLHFDQK